MKSSLQEISSHRQGSRSLAEAGAPAAVEHGTTGSCITTPKERTLKLTASNISQRFLRLKEDSKLKEFPSATYCNRLFCSTTLLCFLQNKDACACNTPKGRQISVCHTAPPRSEYTLWDFFFQGLKSSGFSTPASKHRCW